MMQFSRIFHSLMAGQGNSVMTAASGSELKTLVFSRNPLNKSRHAERMFPRKFGRFYLDHAEYFHSAEGQDFFKLDPRVDRLN